MNEGFEIEQTDTDAINEELSPMEAARSLVDIELQLKDLEAQKKLLKQQLMHVMKQHDTFSLRTGRYTISRVQKPYLKVLSVERLKTELEKRDIPYYTVEAFADSMQEVFKTLAKRAQDPIPGLDYHETEYVMIKVNKK